MLLGALATLMIIIAIAPASAAAKVVTGIDGPVVVNWQNPDTEKMTDTDLDRLEAIHRTNEVRKSRDLAACVIDPLLMQAAQIRAEELAAASLYGHTRPDGRHYSTVVDAPIGENLHRVSNAYLAHKKIGVAQYIVDSWINSPGHFANIVNPRADAIGVGLAPGHNAKGESCWYCVQLFLLEGHTITVVDAPVVA